MHLTSAIACLACSLMIASSADAGTNSFSRSVVSGQPKRIAAYHSWDPNTCQSLAATMKVMTKPKHGTLIPRIVPHTITTSRFGTVRNCAGKPIKALQVDYRSAPSFRGTDTFTIEVIFGWEGRTDTDNYTVTVN
jgi:hypothetical protein